MKSMFFLAAIACILASGVAHAGEEQRSDANDDPHVRSGLTFGMRLGLAAPLGTTANATGGTTGVSQSETTGLMLPVWVDVGARVTRRWYVGGYFQAGDATSGSACGAGCGGYDMRFGVDGEFHGTPTRRVDGWVGAGIGYEILHQSQTGLTTAYRGFELGMLQGGADCRLGSGPMRVGPFAALSFDEYNHIRQISPTSDVSESLASQAIHAWFFLGVRGTYNL